MTILKFGGRSLKLETSTLENHNRFGGCIYLADFSTCDGCSHNIAERIISDWKFDARCKKNIEERNRKGNYRYGKNKE